MKPISQQSRYLLPENPQSTFEVGIVIDFNPALATCDIQLDRGPLIRGVPVLGTQGAQHGTDMSHTSNLRGAAVVLIKVHNQYYVLSTIPSPQIQIDEKISESASIETYGGGNENTYGQPTDKDFSGMRSKDYLTGDKVLKSDGGAELSLMREGVSRLKASALCQFILNRVRDMGRLVTRIFQHFTDFGEVNFTHNDQGRVSIYLRGGADYLEETHPDIAKWTIQAWLGDHPENPKDRLYVRVNDKENTEFVTLAFDIGGNAFLHTSTDTGIHAEEDVQILADKNMDYRADGWGQYYTKGKLLIKSDTKLILQGPRGVIIL